MSEQTKDRIFIGVGIALAIAWIVFAAFHPWYFV